VCLDTSSAEAQLGQDHATLPPLAALHQINPKAARTSIKATDKGPIWPAGKSRDAGNSPETYTIPGDKRQKIVLKKDKTAAHGGNSKTKNSSASQRRRAKIE
jgi:hypothetical protein